MAVGERFKSIYDPDITFGNVGTVALIYVLRRHRQRQIYFGFRSPS